MRERYLNRADAGRALADELTRYVDRDDVVVLALPRGGVPVGVEVAQALHAPLDVFVVRKLGAPGFEELAMGAVASGGVRVLNTDVVQDLGISGPAIEHAAARELLEVERRERAYRGDVPLLDLKGRTVLLVDDGLATGSTMLAAVRAVRQRGPARIVVAVPVASAQASRDLVGEADEVVCPLVPRRFSAVGEWYADFSQTTDEDVIAMLKAHG